MLGQPIAMLIPDVIGFKLTGRLREGVTATDLVLTVTQMLRKNGVVGKFVEFYGSGLCDDMSLADRATIGNMAPEYGATCGIFPIDQVTIDYLRLSGRDEHRIALVEAYAKAQGMWREPTSPDPVFTRHAGARHGHGGAFDGRAEAAAGPGAALGRRRRFRQGSGRWRDGRARRPAGPAGAGGGRQLRPRPWRCGDRRHHLLHQHLEPLCDGRGRAGGPQGARQGIAAEALGEDLAGAGQPGGDRLLQRRRADRRPRRHGLPDRGLWLHHMHRQLRTAGRAHRRCDREQQAGGLGRAVGQPQFRGPGARQCPRQLPGQPAAGGGLCAGRQHQHRPDDAATRHRLGRPAGLSEGYLADAEGGERHRPRRGHPQDVPGAVWRRVPRAGAVAGHQGRRRQRHLSPGTPALPTSRTRRISRA